MDEYTKSLEISSRLTRTYANQIHTVSLAEYFKIEQLEANFIVWWAIRHGRVEKTSFNQKDVLFSKSLARIEEEDFEDVCNPTDLELDVFKLTYGFKWMFDNRGEQSNE